MPTPILDVKNLTKSFGERVLFRDISFSIAEGQHVGLIAEWYREIDSSLYPDRHREL